MTTKADFSADEWTTILEGPTGAAMMVITASHGGTFRETYAEAKAFAEARSQHGESQLLDEIVATKPVSDKTRYHSKEELQAGAIKHLGDAVAILAAKATPEELDGYRTFILSLCAKVAGAHKEHGVDESPEETAAIVQISAALGVAAP